MAEKTETGGSPVDSTAPPSTVSGAGGPSSPGRALALGSQVAARYRIDRLLGVGGMGEVYAAADLMVGGTIALKTLRPDLAGSTQAIERFRREIALARKVTHPHVCRLHDVGTHDGLLFITMELLEGGTLADKIRDRRLELDEVERILRELIEGLSALHAAGIVHRDFKPSNVMLIGERVVITDFGLARSIVEGDATLTADGSFLGTPVYMSPEQVEGRPATAASDIYSLGVVLFELVTGTLPFKEDTAMATATARLHRDPPAPSSRRADLPPRWDAMILRCLARDPARRPARVEDVLVEAIAVQPTLPLIARTPVPAPARRRSRRPVVVGAAALVVVAGGVVVARELATSPAPSPVATPAIACDPATAKLAGVWDASVRSRGEARFRAVSQDVATKAWTVLAGNLDRYATQWSKQWDDACVVKDVSRLTCLDHARVSLSAVASHAIASDALAYAGSYPGSSVLPALDDCASSDVLRAQPPPIAADKRDEAMRLVAAVERARVELRTALDPRALQRLDEAGALLDKLGVAEAAVAWVWRAGATVALYGAGKATLDEAKAAVARAIQRASELRNAAWLAAARVTALELAIDTGTEAEVDDALAKLGEAVERAGNPTRQRADLLSLRARIDIERGLVDRARADLDAARPLRERLESGDLRLAAELAIALDRSAARLPDAIAAARRLLEQARTTWGPTSRRALDALRVLVDVLWQAGEYAEAHKLVSDEAALHKVEGDYAWLRPHAAILAILTKDKTTAEAHVEAMGGPIELGPAYETVIRRAAQLGETAALAWALDHGGILVAFEKQLEIWVMAAKLAIDLGDAKRARDAIGKFPPTQEAEAFASTFELQIAALDNPALARTKLATWNGGDPSTDAIVRGRVARALGDWPTARVQFESYRTALLAEPKPGRRWSSAEIDAYLGEALVELGDAKAALPLLEHAIAVSIACCHGAHPYTRIAEFALARALWETNGDKGRARRLAERARDGFTRDRDRQAAIRWLAR